MCSLKPHQQHVLGCGHRLRFMFFVFNGPSSAHYIHGGHSICRTSQQYPSSSGTFPYSPSLLLTWALEEASGYKD